MRILHRLAHLFQWNTGKVVSWWKPNSTTATLMIGFQCAKCGEIQGVHESHVPQP